MASNISFKLRSADKPSTGAIVPEARDKMGNVTSAHNFDRAAALRQAVLEFLDEHLQDRVENRDAHIITHLQTAANCLGAVERSLGL